MKQPILYNIMNGGNVTERRVTVQGDLVTIQFPYDAKVVEAVRLLPGRRYEPRTKTWTVPRRSFDDVVRFAERHHFDVRQGTPRPQVAPGQATARKWPDCPLPPERPLIVDCKRSGERILYVHQQEGIGYMLDHPRCILADDMGLGKTLQALVAAKAWGLPIHVVCPKSLRLNWEREAEAAGVQLAGIFSWAKLPDQITGDYTLIADESHFAQSSTSKRGRKYIELGRRARVLYSLSGTPMKNGRPINLLPLLIASNHSLARDITHYHRYYCNAQATKWSKWDVSGARHLDELHRLTKDVILRRTKADCLDLPEKIRVFREVEMSSGVEKVYNAKIAQYRAEYFDRLRKGEINKGAEGLVFLTHYRHAGSIAKVEATVEAAGEVLEQGGSVVIFTEFLESAWQIAKSLNAPEPLIGETPLDFRQKLIDDFQAGRSKVFVATIKAGGLGVTLTAAQTAILVDRPWTPGDAIQAEDRLHRIGQKSAVTTVWMQLTDVDREIDKLILKKQDRIDFALEGERKTMRGTDSREVVNRLIVIAGKE